LIPSRIRATVAAFAEFLGTARRKNVKQQICSVIARAVLLASLALAWSAAANAQQFSAWSAPVSVNNMALSDATVCPAVVNSTSPDTNDTHPAISKDGLSLYFASTRTNPDRPFGNSSNYHLWVTKRASLDSCWGTPMYLGDNVNDTQLINNVEVQDFAPNLTPDGHWLYFHSNRDGVADLYVSHRNDTSNDFGWEAPINLVSTINTPGFAQAGPTYFEDVATGTHYLYYTQKPNPPPPPASNDDLFDIYFSTCVAPNDLAACNTQGLWGQGVPVDRLNSPVRDTRTAIRRDGLEMILSTRRTGSLGSENLWVSTRPTVTADQGNWEIPQPINCEWQENVTAILNSTPPPTSCPAWNPIDPPASTAFVNSAAFDGGPALSWDGTELYFFRVLDANNNVRNCTVLPTSPDTGTSPFCRDLYVSKRTYITTTVLSSSANPSVFGQPVTLPTTVSSAADSAPTGTVTFSDGATSLGTGTLASGQTTLTTSSLSVGSHSITAQYGGDRISGVSSGSLTQNVEYGICPLYDQTKSVHSGATFPIKLQLCDANGNDVSAAAIIVHATSFTTVSGFSGTPDAPGNANPDNDFRFDATLGSTGGYIFNLSTRGLASGTYSLQFTAGGDPVTHSVNFGVN
jgi:hypothetical protein